MSKKIQISEARLSVQPVSYPIMQPAYPRVANHYVTCMSVFLILLALPFYMAGYGMITIVALVFAVGLVLSLGTCLWVPLTAVSLYFQSWWFEGYNCCCIPKGSFVDLYSKLLYLFYQQNLIGLVRPTAKAFKVDELRKKAFLMKKDIDYALNLAVPVASEEEFVESKTCLGNIISRVKEDLGGLLPMNHHFVGFGPGEDPVAFVMERLGSVYPTIIQVWDDKQSDAALVRFCKVGLAAGRIESVFEDTSPGAPSSVADGAVVKYYLFRTSQLAGLEVMDGYARYGSDVYFDTNWNPVKIEDVGYGKPARDNVPYVNYSTVVTFRPGEEGWAAAKFRFRSSMLTLVTLVDHLYGIHLQISNLLVVAMRENMDTDHPVRRFITPYTYQTIGVNNNARQNLIAPRTMANRCFAFTDKGWRLAWAAAPNLLMGGAETLNMMSMASERQGLTDAEQMVAALKTSINRRDYIENYLKKRRGIETPYYEFNEKYWDVTYKFVTDYLKQYYGGNLANVAQDAQVMAMLRQYFHQMEFTAVETIGLSRDSITDAAPSPIIASFITDVLTMYICLVTSGHEQVGNVAPYTQDASWCASKFVPGASCGTKNGAINAALLISFTSTPMPLLMKPLPDDPNPQPWESWAKLFPDPNQNWVGYSGPTGNGGHGGTPTRTFDDYQAELQALARESDEYNAQTSEPVYCFNPKYLESSVSV